MKRWAPILGALTTLAGLSAASNATEPDDPAAGASPVLLSRQTAGERSQATAAYLRSTLGERRFDALGSALRAGFDGYSPVAACEASFIAPGELDVGLALVDKDFANIVYAVAHARGAQERLMTVARFRIAENRVPALSCESWTSLARTKATYQRLSASSAAYSDLRLATRLDSLCVVPMDSEMEFSCFSYSGSRKDFVGVGGWFND